MSAEHPENLGPVRTFQVPTEAVPYPAVARTLTSQGAPAQGRVSAEAASAQLDQIAASQARAREAESEIQDPDLANQVAAAQQQQDQQGTASPEEDIQRLLPDPNLPFALSDGTLVVARHLRLREFLSMLKIITRGASMALGSVPLNVNDENFSGSLISLFIFAIPEAEDEAVEFVRKIVDPAPPQGGWGKNQDARVAAEAHLDGVMENPDLEDMLSIIETVIRKEGPDLRRLGKRLQDAMSFAQRTGQTANN